MTIQTDVEMVTEEHTDLLEVTPGQTDTSAMGQTEATTNTETPMDLGNSCSGEVSHGTNKMCQYFGCIHHLKNVHCVCPRCSYVSELLVNLGVEAKHVEAADGGKKVTEAELKVATEELTHDSPAASLETSGKHVDLL